MANMLLLFSKVTKKISLLDLAGHVPVELSRQLNLLLKADVGNHIYVEIIGER